MAPSHSFPLASLSLILHQTSCAFAAPWIVTKVYEQDVYTEDYGYRTTTRTLIDEITPTASPMPAALSTATHVTSDSYDDAVTVVQVLYPSGAGIESTYKYYNYQDSNIITQYFVDMVLTAPTSCSSQWTVTTAVPVYVPNAIEDALLATSMSTSYSVDDRQPFQPTTYTRALAFIDPTQLPASSLNRLSNSYQHTIYREYGCYDSSADSGSSYSYYDGSDGGSWLYDRYYYGVISPLGILLACILGWFGVWLIVGLIESWFQFQRLMRGWQARRGFPISWCMLAPIVSCLLLLFCRKGFQARTFEEAQVLQEKWQHMVFWRKVGLWLRWGFGFSYPPMLGPAPVKVGRPSKRPVAATAPLLGVFPPRSVMSDVHSDSGSNRGDSAASGPAMAYSPTPGQTLQVPPSIPSNRQQQAPNQPIPEVPSTTSGALPANTHATETARSDAARKLISDLQDLLSRTQGHSARSEVEETSDDPDQSRTKSPQGAAAGDNLALDDAENPLQLLARASDLQFSSAECRDAPILSTSSGSQSSLRPNSSPNEDLPIARSFFVPVKAKLDLGPDMDPIELGLTTLHEAELLFSFFYENLAHTRWGLDPTVHTVSFVRSQSAFLFTSMLAAAARFNPSTAALSKRLTRHCTSLAYKVIVQRYRSVEIVLAFMVNVPWMAPGSSSGDDDTCSYIAMALTVALDLSLNKIVTPSTGFDSTLQNRLAKADCIDAKRALYMDGFEAVDPASEWGRRLLRRRERAWIALFVLERGVCLARGRSYTVPLTALIENCDRWHISDIADSRDGPMNSMAVLRRNLDELLRKVKSRCDSCRLGDIGSEAAQSIKKLIEDFYDQWYAAWALEIGGPSRCLPPYVEILVTHTQLSTYGGVINHPTAPLEVKRFFRAAGLSSALNVMRAAIQGESRLKSMPNNTVIMIAFAACSALSLSVTPADSRSILAPSVRHLIEETADVLERIGAVPAHREGASVLYGRLLRELVRRAHVGFVSQKHIESAPVESLQPSSTLSDYCPIPSLTQPPMDPSTLWPETLQFSAMSDHQIIDAVNRADSAFGMNIPDVLLEDLMNWDWFDFANTADLGFGQ
ncbi:hypothetical protein KXX42_000736 [Aspergillus fumigatus]|nr:hypothetical protein KXX42_000736 [Aspergillus fumigatus]